MASTTQPFRLLDLAPELRNLIYEAVFEDHAPPDVDVFSAMASLPQSALIATCRRVHAEIIGMSRKAAAEFQDAHTFFITVRAESFMRKPSSTLPSDLQTLLTNSRDIPVPSLRRLEIRVGSESGRRWVIQLKALMNGQAAVMQETPGPGMEFLSRVEGHRFAEMARQYDVRPTTEELLPMYQALDVENVVKTLLATHHWDVDEE